MEILFVIAGCVVLLFAIGVVLVVKGSSGFPVPGDAVPPDELLQTRQELGSAREEEGRLKQQLDTLAVELHQAQSHIQETKELEGLLSTLREQDAENQNAIQHLDRSLAFLRQKADDQARAAKEIIETLIIKRDALDHEIADIKNRFDEAAFFSIKEENQRLQEDIKNLLGKVEGFEHQIAERAKEDAVRESASCERYEKETARLKQGLLQVIQRIRAAGDEMAAVKQAYDMKCQQLLDEKEDQRSQSQQDIFNMQEQLIRFQEQMKGNNEVILALEQELAASRDNLAVSDKRIIELQEQLQTQKGEEVSAAEDWAAEQALREERARLQQDKNALEAKIAELRESHEFLQQKEKVLQRELTRSRTEAMGFRRICEGYKTRLEECS